MKSYHCRFDDMPNDTINTIHVLQINLCWAHRKDHFIDLIMKKSKDELLQLGVPISL